MSINSINNYGTSATSNTGSTANTGSSSGSTLSMDDFLQLLVAQLKNQDMYNTMDDSEYMAQMAQFSMLQAITDMSELSMTSYGVSLIGKEVTLAQIGDDGSVSSYQGLVDSVNFYNGSTQVVVDGKNYALSSVMSVKEPNIIIPDSTIIDTSDAVPEASAADAETDGTTGETNAAEAAATAEPAAAELTDSSAAAAEPAAVE